jgi:hypothetical protein
MIVSWGREKLVADPHAADARNECENDRHNRATERDLHSEGSSKVEGASRDQAANGDFGTAIADAVDALKIAPPAAKSPIAAARSRQVWPFIAARSVSRRSTLLVTPSRL